MPFALSLHCMVLYKTIQVDNSQQLCLAMIGLLTCSLLTLVLLAGSMLPFSVVLQAPRNPTPATMFMPDPCKLR
jgi:hypothetical protein